MIPGELKAKVDRIWDAFWSGGIMVMPFSMAPPAEQAEFAQAAGTVQELKDQAARRLAQTHHLLKTLQSRAFSGTL
ncbi:MAG TPA: hypothetical protein PLG38_11935 [Propionibacteriaceae bacterium]|nr:hypothetical protein [Propionibacteriaceae bacterium]HQE32712.1 hypothetical protein [Propionibacteriaceae bacterium]